MKKTTLKDVTQHIKRKRLEAVIKIIRDYPDILKDKKMKKLYNRIIEYSGIN